jgi:DNA-binding NtrC family response regulator
MSSTDLKRSLLIIDDDDLFADSLRIALAGPTTEVASVTSLAAARVIIRTRAFDAILLDNNLPDGSGLDILEEILAQNDRTKVILATAFPSFDHAVKAVKQGAYDYISKPIDLPELEASIERACEASRLQAVEQLALYKRDRNRKESSIVGFSKANCSIRSMIERAAKTQAPVLITGETGTGKNVIAKAIHFLGSESTQPLVNLNCAAIPETLIEAELFGAEKGSYTGAVQTRKGIFELADQGTLFLDEIGEMPPQLQAKLLTALEDKRIRRVGGDKDRIVNVRIIAATNAEPEKAIEEGRFRRDLFYRMSVIRIHIPPLRERPEDIPELCEHFIRAFAPSRPVQISADECSRLQDYSFPGNVRELRNIIERALILQEGDEIFPSRLLETTPIQTSKVAEQVADRSATTLHSVSQFEMGTSLSEVEKQHIFATFSRCNGNIAHTAKALDISLSTTKRKLRSYGLLNARHQVAAGSF